MQNPTIDTYLKELKIHHYGTYMHSLRVGDLLQQFGKYQGLDLKEQEKLKFIGIIHDIGKLNVNVSILDKPSSLTKNEWNCIASHPSISADIVRNKIGITDKVVIQAISDHHENVDGTGYPHNKKNNNISLYGRMIRIVDSFDAMVFKRSYSNETPIKMALENLKELSEKHYDKALVISFEKMINNIINDRF